MAWNIDPSSGQDVVWDEEGAPVAQAIGPNWPINAPLIAAAPEMLKVLKDLELYAPDPMMSFFAQVLRDARAVVAKAEGRS